MPYVALLMLTSTGTLIPGSSRTTPGPMNTRAGDESPPMYEIAPNPLFAPLKLSPATKWLGSPNRLLVFVICAEAPYAFVFVDCKSSSEYGPPFRKSGIGTPPIVVLGMPGLEHSSPEPSSQGVSLGALPLRTFWCK